jgi:hypothetical protein
LSKELERRDASDGLQARYANYFQVGRNDFEVLIDFGQAYEGEPPQIHTRIVTSPAYAAELVELLRRSVETPGDRE